MRITTLAEIRERPADYLGEGGEPEEYETFVRAVEALVNAGVPEGEAIALVWNEGDWYPRAAAVVDGWLPTHIITTPYGHEYVMLVEDGVLYTVGEWAFAVDADYEIVDGELCFQGEPAADETLTPLG